MKTIDHITKAINNLDIIIKNDSFEVFPEIKEILTETIYLIEKSNNEEAKKKLNYCFRLLREAPPRNADLGYNTLIQLDEALKLLS